MKIYRVYEVGSPGEVGISEYFINLKDAEKRFNQIIAKRRKNELTCTKDDLDGKPNIINSMAYNESIIRNIRWFYWRKTSLCNEGISDGNYYITFNEIRIKEIEVQE